MKAGTAILVGGGVAVVALGAYVAKSIDDLETGDPNLDRLIIRGAAFFYSKLYRVDPRVVMAIIHQESGGNPKHYLGDTASSKGPSVGPMQVLRATAQELGLWTPPPGLDPRAAYAELASNERQGIAWGCAVLAQKLKEAGGDYEEAMRRYNGSGPAADAYRDSVDAWLADNFDAPAEAETT